MLASVLLTLVVALAGTLVSYAYDDDMPLPVRACFGAVSGLAAAGLIAFVAANLVGIQSAALLAAAAGAVVAGLALTTSIRARALADVLSAAGRLRAGWRRAGVEDAGQALYVLALVTLVWLAFERVLVIDADGISTGYANNIGDLPFHTHISASFAFSQNYPPMDPTFAGSGFAYPYMADFVSAMYLALGAGYDFALFLLNVCLALALVGTAYWFTRLLSRSRLAALLAPALILLSGGLGWLLALDHLRASEQGIVGFMQALPQNYTIEGDSAYRWGNSITTLLVTQRSMLFGIPLTLMVFSLLWRVVRAPAPVSGSGRTMKVRDLSPATVVDGVRRQPAALAAGVLTGMLPLIHAHSFIVVMGTAFGIGVLFRQWREGRWLPWAIYVLSALAIALPEVWWSTRDSLAIAGTFFGLEIGWDRGDLDPVTFWLLNTGLFIPLIVLGLAVPRVRRRLPAGLVLFSLPFLAWFVVPNVVKLAPWVWDNIKVLFYWYVGMVPLAALLIARMLRGRPIVRLAGIGVLLSLTLAGGLDVWRVISHQTTFGEFDRAGMALANGILDRTEARAVVLHAPTWNTPVYLTGRQSVLGYPGHMWSRGLDYAAREEDVRRIYEGGADTAALLARYGVAYVVVGPLERAYGTVDEGQFESYQEVVAVGEHRLFKIAAP